MPVIVKCDNCGKEESGIFDHPLDKRQYRIGIPDSWYSAGIPENLRVEKNLPNAVVICSARCMKEYDMKNGLNFPPADDCDCVNCQTRRAKAALKPN